MRQSRGKGLTYVSQFGDLTKITFFLDTYNDCAPDAMQEQCCDEADAIKPNQNNQHKKDYQSVLGLPNRMLTAFSLMVPGGGGGQK